jgi:hypothetical protein
MTNNHCFCISCAPLWKFREASLADSSSAPFLRVRIFPQWALIAASKHLLRLRKFILIPASLFTNCTNLMELTSPATARRFLITATTIPVASQTNEVSTKISISVKVKAVTKTARKWQVYRNKCLIRAKQLTRALSFVDSLGREHRGKKGDYLVESDAGTRRIWPRQLFEDSHVSMEPKATTQSVPAAPARKARRNTSGPQRIGPKGTKDFLCAKPASHSRTLAVNSLRYNI